MKTHCQNCGEKFTNGEINRFLETLEYSDVRFICDECYDMECNHEIAEDIGSDADMGL